MNIAVCVKQVPDTASIKWTENNTIQREGLESIINPFDTYALETSLKIKDKNLSTKIMVLTMGPPQSQEVVKYAISLGVDGGFVVSDKKFAGADTIATSRTLARAISAKINDVDLVLCGQFAIDGDTAQTGPMLANNLGFPVVTYVKEIISLEDNSVLVKKEVEDGIEILKVELPAVLCMLKCDYEPRRPLINGFKVAQKYNVPIYSKEDINIEEDQIGFKGSPTCVSKAFRPETKVAGEIFELSIDDTVNKLIEVLDA